LTIPAKAAFAVIVFIGFNDLFFILHYLLQYCRI